MLAGSRPLARPGFGAIDRQINVATKTFSEELLLRQMWKVVPADQAQRYDCEAAILGAQQKNRRQAAHVVR